MDSDLAPLKIPKVQHVLGYRVYKVVQDSLHPQKDYEDILGVHG